MSRMNLEDWEELTEERRKDAIANKAAKAPAATPEERRQAKRDADKRYREKLAKKKDTPTHPLLDESGRAIGCALHKEPAPEPKPEKPTPAPMDYDWKEETIGASVPEIPLRPATKFPPMEVNFTRTEWAGRINRFWREGRESAVAAIMTAGENLAASRQNMEADEWRAMIEHDLDMGRNTAQRLVIIGASKRLRAHTERLPASWATLYELTKLSDADFDALVSKGILRPDMERKEIVKALPPPAAPARGDAPEDKMPMREATRAEMEQAGYIDHSEPPEPSEAMIAAGVRALNEWGSFHPNNAKKIARDIYMAMTMVRA